MYYNDTYNLGVFFKLVFNITTLKNIDKYTKWTINLAKFVPFFFSWS